MNQMLAGKFKIMPLNFITQKKPAEKSAGHSHEKTAYILMLA